MLSWTHDGYVISCYCHFNSICYNSWGVAHEVEYDHKNRYSSITDISFTLFMVTIRACCSNGDGRVFMPIHRYLIYIKGKVYMTPGDLTNIPKIINDSLSITFIPVMVLKILNIQRTPPLNDSFAHSRRKVFLTEKAILMSPLICEMC